MIIDTMYCFPGLDFTVDTSVLSVEVIWPIVPGAVYGEMVNANIPIVKYFQPKDHILLLSYGVKLPYCFNYAKHIPYFQFAWFQNPTIDLLNELSPPTGKLHCPLPNHEHETNVLIPYMPPDPLSETSIGVIGGSMSFSMVGVPDDLDGVTLQVYPFIKIKHNIELQA